MPEGESKKGIAFSEDKKNQPSLKRKELARPGA